MPARRRSWKTSAPNSGARRRRRDLIRLQLGEHDEQAPELTGKLAALQTALENAEAALTRHRQELTEVGDELRRRQSEKDAAVQVLGDFRVALAAKTEQEKKHREALGETEKLVAELKREVEAAVREAAEIQAAIAAQREEEARAAEVLVDLAKSQETAEAGLTSLRAERDEAQQAQKKTESRLRAIRRERNGLAEQAHRLELSLGEWKVRAETHRDHLLQEYGFDWEERLDPEWAMEREEAAARIESLRGEIRALGPVNPGAIAEYEGLRNRHEFLRGQSDDLAQAKESLQKDHRGSRADDQPPLPGDLRRRADGLRRPVPAALCRRQRGFAPDRSGESRWSPGSRSWRSRRASACRACPCSPGANGP